MIPDREINRKPPGSVNKESGLPRSVQKPLKVWTASRSQVMQRDIYAIGVKKGYWVLPDEMTPKAVINFCRFFKGPEGKKEVQGLAQAARLDKRRVGQQTRTDVAYGAIFTVQLQDWKREEKEVSAIFDEQIVDLRRQINILSLEKDREISELSKKYMPACTYTEMEREALQDECYRLYSDEARRLGRAAVARSEWVIKKATDS